MGKPTVLIAEDHPMISIMLSEMVEELLKNCEVVVVETVEKARQLKIKPSVLIVDLDLPDSKGMQTVQAFSALFPYCPKLICSGLLDPEISLYAKQADFAYVNKASNYPKMLETLESLFLKANVMDVPARFADKTLINEYHSNVCAPGSERPLTFKQVEIMRKTAEGLSAKEVAREMDISPDTVRGHIKEIFLRLGAKNKGQAVEIFIRAERKAKLLDRD